MSFCIAVEPNHNKSIIRLCVAGAFDGAGVALLKQTCADLIAENGGVRLEIDLANLTFIDEESARALCRLGGDAQIELLEPRFLTLAMMKKVEAKR